MRRGRISRNEENLRGTMCVSKQEPHGSLKNKKNEGESIRSPCLDITAAALYISFCRQSALVAAAECRHQSGISRRWQNKVKIPKLDCFSEALRESFVFQIYKSGADMLQRGLRYEHRSSNINTELRCSEFEQNESWLTTDPYVSFKGWDKNKWTDTESNKTLKKQEKPGA